MIALLVVDIGHYIKKNDPLLEKRKKKRFVHDLNNLELDKKGEFIYWLNK